MHASLLLPLLMVEGKSAVAAHSLQLLPLLLLLLALVLLLAQPERQGSG